jgi:hypothetical protein
MKKLSWIFALTSLISACYYDNASELHPGAGLNTNCDTVNVTYTNSIAPIFSSNCGTNNSCHSASIAEGGVILDNYAGAIQADHNQLISSIEHTSEPIMPPSGKLSDCNINLIKIWVLNGKPQ